MGLSGLQLEKSLFNPGEERLPYPSSSAWPLCALAHLTERAKNLWISPPYLLTDANLSRVGAELDLYSGIVDHHGSNSRRKQMSFNITACGRCGDSVGQEMRYCPSCGRRLAPVNRRVVATVVCGAVALFSVALGLQTYLIPPKPEGVSKQHSETPLEESVDDPQMAALRRDLESEPTNLEKLKIMAGFLGDKLRSNPQSSNAIVFEAIDVLGKILAISPKDPGALVMMADVSFDQRAFTKAQEFYEKYLALEPDNLGARARYASTLTFLGDYDKSIQQLDTVLKEDPKNFPAMAYLSITYAQRGDIPKAREVGVTALNLAPSDEAKARFSAFMSTLDGNAPSNDGSPVRSQNSGGVEGFVAAVRSNPVAGPKLVGHQESKSGELSLVFKDFPMAQMPPFAKEKFFSSLRSAAAAAKLDSIKTLVFVDADSGSKMEQIALDRK